VTPTAPPRANADRRKNAYLAILQSDPTHLLALNNLGSLLYETGYRTAARTAYAQAVKHHPNDPTSRVNLANALRDAGDPAQARIHYEAALALEPSHQAAHHGLGNVYDDEGDLAAAAQHWRIAFENRPIVTLPYRGQSAPIPVLLLATPARGNVQMLQFLDADVFQTHIVYAEYTNCATPLPAHSLVINAIGDADLAAPSLAAAQALLARTQAPVINPPAAVLATGREGSVQLLGGIPGLIAPRAVTLPRPLIDPPTLARHGFAFPLLLRTPGFHTGLHFERVETPADLPNTLAKLPGESLTVIEYLDARGPDGKARKFRVMMIGGQLYPLHLAISNHWKIHYFTADMAGNPSHRDEDRAFLDDMAAVLGPRAMAALAQVQQRLALDYAGIDFGLSPSGDVLLFEANATMVVLAPGADEKWAYRLPAVDRIHAAVHRLLLSRIT
jgi:hypothetical protein